MKDVSFESFSVGCGRLIWCSGGTFLIPVSRQFGRVLDGIYLEFAALRYEPYGRDDVYCEQTFLARDVDDMSLSTDVGPRIPRVDRPTAAGPVGISDAAATMNWRPQECAGVEAVEDAMLGLRDRNHDCSSCLRVQILKIATAR